VAVSGRRLVYLATATAGDGEMAARIARHRARRATEKWRTVEEPVDLACVLLREARTDTAVLVDCLTLWLTNLMAAERPIEAETDRLVAALAAVAGPVVIVSNEVGSGIIPANALARRYADELGTLNQRVAEVVDRVALVVAGMPLVLKPARKQNEVVL
jgi:adenosylcobinamide kinase/adenosylcobinamide-phosphate guanylyltransferase